LDPKGVGGVSFQWEPTFTGRRMEISEELRRSTAEAVTRWFDVPPEVVIPFQYNGPRLVDATEEEPDESGRGTEDRDHGH